ncbi:ankyrin repeat domain-containing protein [Wolbachia endosymbiont of Pentidionis agamae]|uniref:ankyrin repeat domain-containing protein n=1 Tax=Wolbachia endosymbiont of Pentidionis agamae TaxID=3110435 RepID=UPI002FD2293C
MVTKEQELKDKLFTALRENNFQKVKQCVEEMKNNGISKITELKDDDEAMPLHIAVQKNNLESAQFLVDEGADINAIWREDFGYKYTPLSIAAKNNNFKIVKFLLDKGSELNASGFFLIISPLHYAARNFPSSSTPEYLEIIELLLKKGADINAKNEGGNTSIYEAIKSNNFKIMERLFNKGAKIDLNNNSNQTLLHIAASNSFYSYDTTNSGVKIMEFLLKHNLDINIKDEGGNTPMHYAIRSRNPRMIKILYDNNANITIKNNEGKNSFRIC